MDWVRQKIETAAIEARGPRRRSQDPDHRRQDRPGNRHSWPAGRSRKNEWFCSQMAHHAE